ncbi:alpha/beta fold hydrolase [Bacillus salitolerans]|uniref:Alpha/beta fold hydrolase n=1 Tax=Bacillus salitolerans TaxID=1437434 RepID=A0ABW4LT49_9BACI
MREFIKEISDHRFHGYEYGTNLRPTVVLLHGMTSDTNSFHGLIEFLKDDFHILTLDLPGHGETPPLLTEKDYHFSSLAEKIYSVVQEFTRLPFFLLGHSWGADLSLHLAALYPDKIKGMILLDGGYVFPEHTDLSLKQALIGWDEYYHSTVFESWDLVKKSYQEYTTKIWDERLDQTVSSNFIKADGKYQLRANKESLLSTIKAFYFQPCSSTFHLIHCPVLLIHATLPKKDPSRERGIEAIRKGIGHIRVVGIPNTKHNPHWDVPELIASEVMKWKSSLFI